MHISVAILAQILALRWVSAISPCKLQLPSHSLARLCAMSQTEAAANSAGAHRADTQALAEQSDPPGVRNQVRKTVQDVLSWQKRKGVRRIPRQHAESAEERKLGHGFAKVLIRRFKDYGQDLSRSKLSPAEVDLVNSVAGVPLHGCSAAASSPSIATQHAAFEGAASRTAPPVSVGVHHTDITNASFDDCQEILERRQEHLDTLKSMLPDVKTMPSASRVRELANLLGIPKQADRQTLALDVVFRQVQQQFRERVHEQQDNPNSGRHPAVVSESSSGGQHSVAKRTSASGVPEVGRGLARLPDGSGASAAKKARVATAVASSGGPHPAAPSDRLDVVESFSSGGPHPAGKCHGPRSPMVFMKILEPIWANEVADGQKMFECVANRTMWQLNSYARVISLSLS